MQTLNASAVATVGGGKLAVTVPDRPVPTVVPPFRPVFPIDP